MDLLIPSTGLLFWMSITFLVVLALLWKFGFPVIVGMVNERKRFIDESLKNAHDANMRLSNIRQEGEAILREAREKQAQMLKEAAQAKEAIMESARRAAKDEGARLAGEAKAEIEAEKKAAIRDIRAQVAALSVAVAEEILREKLATPQSQAAFIDKLLESGSVKRQLS